MRVELVFFLDYILNRISRRLKGVLNGLFCSNLKYENQILKMFDFLLLAWDFFYIFVKLLLSFDNVLKRRLLIDSLWICLQRLFLVLII